MDEHMVERIRKVLSNRDDVEEKRMFGGLTFMVAGHMCCGVAKNDGMFRVGSEAAEAALDDRGVRPVDMTGRTLGGMVLVDAAVLRDDDALARWVARGVAFVTTLPPRDRPHRGERWRRPSGATAIALMP